MHDPLDLPGLRRHHRVGREQMRRLHEAATGGADARREAAAGFLSYFDLEVVPHMRAEERHLLPLLLGGDHRVARILREHERLHVLARRLREALALGVPDGEHLRVIAELLRGHIALEERELYPEATERRARSPRRGAEWAAPEGELA